MHKKLTAAVLAGAMTITACGGSSDDPSEDASEDAGAAAPDAGDDAGAGSDGSDTGSGSLSIEGDDSSVQVEFNGLPDDFPDVVVVPEGYVALQVQRQEAGGKVGFTAIGTAGADTQTVFAAMQVAYDQGPPSSLVNGDVHGVTYEDVDGYEISYLMEDNADGLSVVTIGVFPR